MARRTILLTGACGFIGSHTASILLERGDRVVGLDNMNDYYSVDLKRNNARQLLEHSKFEFVKGDIRDERLVRSVFAQHHFDAVIHLAAMAGVRASVDAPQLYFDVNVGGTINLLEAARRSGRPNFVLASTSSAYGRTESIPFVESDRADSPLAPYPATKRSAELLGHSYHHMHGMDFTALRFFTVYGPANRPDMLAHLALDACFGRGELTLHDNGMMWRDWTFATDIADGVVRASDRRLGYQIINLGRGEPVLLREFVEKVAATCERTIRWKNAAMPQADVNRTWANIDKARRLLGYQPQVSTAEGIERLVAWYRAHYAV